MLLFKSTMLKLSLITFIKQVSSVESELFVMTNSKDFPSKEETLSYLLISTELLNLRTSYGRTSATMIVQLTAASSLHFQ